MQFEHNLAAIREGFLIMTSPSSVRLQYRISNPIWNFGEFRPLWASLAIFGCAWKIFLFFVTVKPPCHLIMCERTCDCSRRFVTVTARQPQLQLLSNHSVNDVILFVVYLSHFSLSLHVQSLDGPGFVSKCC